MMAWNIDPWEDGSVLEEEVCDECLVLEGSVIRSCRFVQCSFRSTRWIEVVTDRCEFEECDFTGARLGSSVHQHSSFLNCKFIDADLYGARFDGCRMVGSNFVGANVSDLKVVKGDWSYVQMRMLALDGLDFS